MRLKIGAVLVVLLMAGFSVSLVAADVSVQQSSSSSTSQNANVEGGETRVEQESTVRTETNDALVEQHAEMNATKKAGEPAQVERNVDRNVVNPNNESITADIDQNIDEGENSLTASQEVTQGVGDQNNANEAVQSTEFTADANSDTNTDFDVETETAAETSNDADVNPLRQGGSFTLLVQTIDTIGDAVADLFTL